MMLVRNDADCSEAVLSGSCGHYLEEPYLPRGGGVRYPVPGQPGVVDHQGFLGCQRDQRELGRDNACRVKVPAWMLAT